MMLVVGCLLTFVITLVVLVLLLAYVPHFDKIYTWMQSKPPPERTCLGILLNAVPSSDVGRLASATTGLANAVIEVGCPMKDKLKVSIMSWSQDKNNTPLKGCKQSIVIASLQKIDNEINIAKEKGRLSDTSAAVLSSKFETFVNVFVDVLCENDSLTPSDAAKVAIEFIDAIC